MNVSETALVFDCVGETLVGVLATNGTLAETGVVLVVGGPQYRAGSHRYFVQLARALAGAGFPTLRFDCRGMGDSSGGPQHFEDIADDIRAAIDTLQQRSPAVRQVVLWGLCDGASAALLYLQATADARVAGLCLLNPWVRSQVSLARTHIKHYYPQRLMHHGFWLKLFSGRVAIGALSRLWRSIGLAFSGTAGAPSYQQRMASALAAFGGPVLLLLSETDYTAKEFVEFTQSDRNWQVALARARVQRQVLPDADHTLSGTASKVQAQGIMQAWLREQFAATVDQTTREGLNGHEAH